MDQDRGLDMRDTNRGGGASRTPRYVHLDAAAIANGAPGKFRHSLEGHPLMSLESFAELARRRPPNRVRVYDAQRVTAGDDLEKVAENHATRLTLDEMVRSIEENNTYLFIMNAENDPVYAPFARDLLEEVKVALRVLGREMVRGWAWVFISAPNTVTPYHRDHEETCLFQLRGKKTLSVWRPNDPEVCSEAENEHFHANWSLAQTVFNERVQPRAQTFDLERGEALYMPFSAPHWVQNGPETSISFSVTFNTRDTVSLESTYKMNALLRRRGLEPRPVGASVVRDRVKEQAWGVIDRARAALGRASSASGPRY